MDTTSSQPHTSSTNTFEGVTYYIASSFSPQRALEIEAALLTHGAHKSKGLDDPELNIVIADGPRWEGWHVIEDEDMDEQTGAGQSSSGDQQRRKVEVVTDFWIDRSIILNRAQPPVFFSVNPAQIFSGVVACATGLPPTDLEALSGGITALGGQWRMGLTRDVTHLFAISAGTAKFETALHYQKNTNVKVLVPHWFDDSMRLGTGKLSTADYEWPDPRILTKSEDGAAKEETDADRAHAALKRNMFATAALLTPSMGRFTPPPDADISLVSKRPQQLTSTPLSFPEGYTLPQVWKGRRIVLSRTLCLYHGRRAAVEASVERAGGVIVKFEGDSDDEEPEVEYEVEVDDETTPTKKKVKKMTRLSRNERQRRRAEAQAVQECDILVTRWRYGRAYVQAVRTNKTIGTLAWLYHAQSTGILVRPVDQLLHYPVPKRVIDGFVNHVVTVTNYTGEAREYLKKLISVMGATFTASMSNQNTALIAANVTGTKAVKAQSWSIPVVNHTWIEDCFIQWRNLTPALERYIVFPPGIDFSGMLGERGVWVGLSGEPPAIAGSEEDGQVQRRIRDRLELEAEELADQDEILSDLEGEENEQASVAALLAPSASAAKENSKPPDASDDGFTRDMQMDIDIDPQADEWEIPVLDDPVPDADADEEARSQLTPRPKSKGKAKDNGTPIVPTTSKNARKPSAQSPPVKKGGRPVSDAEDRLEEDESARNDVLELEDSSDEERARRKGAKAKAKAAPTVKAPARPTSPAKAAAKAKKGRTPSNVTSPSITSEDEARKEPEAQVKIKPRPKPKRAPEPQPVAEEEEESDDEDEFPSHMVLTRPTSKEKAGGRQQLPPSSEIDEDEQQMDVDEQPTEPAPAKKGKASASTKKAAAKTKAPTQPSDNDSDSAIIVSARKAKPGTPVAGPSTQGLLNRVKADARTRVKKKKVVEAEVESEDESEEVVVISKKSSKAEAKAKKVVKGKKVSVSSAEEEPEEEEEEEEEEQEVKPSRSKGKSASKAKPTATISKGKNKAPAQDTKASRKKPLRVYSTSVSPESEDDANALASEPPLSETEVEAPRKGKGKAKDTEKDSGSISTTRAIPGPASRTNAVTNGKASTSASAKSKSKKRAEPSESENSAEEEEEEEEEEAVIVSNPRRKSAKSTAAGKKGSNGTAAKNTSTPRTPKRVMSVLMPSLNLSTSRVKVDQADGKKAKAKAREQSEEEEESQPPVSTRGRGRPSTKKASGKSASKVSAVPASKAKPKSKHATSPSSSDGEAEEKTESTEDEEEIVSPRTRAVARTESIRAAAGHVFVASGSTATVSTPTAGKAVGKSSKPAPMDVDPPSAGPSSSVPRRSAAAKASQRLHDTIMPDVMSFEEQMRKATKAKRSSGRAGLDLFVVKGAEDDDGYTLSTAGSRKRGSTSDDEEEEVERKKKRRVSDVNNAGQVKKEAKGKGAAKEKASMDVDQDPLSGVKIMTTQVALGDDTIKSLKKLGAVVTTRPNECTHLLARQVVRTEKFLCALASAQWILSEKWATASASAKELLPEKNFVLKDKDGEKKYNIDLAKSLRRAKENHGKMLDGHTFYATPKVPVDIKLLKNVVNACGGTLSTQTPTARIINAAPETRHVISCKEDISIWRPLAQQSIKIYTQELLLTGILKQEMEWDENFTVQA